ncbi:MAG TPA: NAD(+) diphosphatase [Aliidongia sp.]|nr:NAD(+) diphosphatase [Aliidongia sp.]
MRRPNFYSAGGLDRVGHRRKDPEWLEARLGDDSSLFVPVWRSQNLVRELPEGPRPVLLTRHEVAALIATGPDLALLGVESESARFALELSSIESPLDSLELDQEGLRFRDLRGFGPLLAPQEGALLAYARGLMYWHTRHRFCGVCGFPTVSVEGGHVRRCTNESCATSHFPRTDPAVIMLVTDGDNCLLGRQKVWPPGMFSTLAGFVEPGESLEEAVAREVFEESGIVVEQATYHSSQPWPFPASIMLGFWATAKTREIEVDGAELEQARWVSRQFLLEHRDDDSFRMPRKDSIARRLIEDWLHS